MPFLSFLDNLLYDAYAISPPQKKSVDNFETEHKTC